MPLFKVRGWFGEKSQRSPIGPVITIEASDGESAAFQYADSRRTIVDSDWWDVGANPPLVIRVSNQGDQDP